MKIFMKGLLFLSRLAFLCNLLFLVCLVMQRTEDLIAQPDTKNTIIILGWFLAPFINFGANMGYLIRIINKKPLNIPIWLVVLNLLFLLLQIFIHFILPT